MNIKRITAAVLCAPLTFAMTGCELVEELIAEETSSSSKFEDPNHVDGEDFKIGGVFGKDPEPVGMEELKTLMLDAAYEYKDTLQIDGGINVDDVVLSLQILTNKHLIQDGTLSWETSNGSLLLKSTQQITNTITGYVVLGTSMGFVPTIVAQNPVF